MVSVIIPTYNAALYLPSLLTSLEKQTQTHELIIIDSESTDDTVMLVKKSSAKLIQIKKAEFNHGSTRNLGVSESSSDIVIFMTQDALPTSNNSLEKLVNMLCSRADIALAYGRQIPYDNTGIFGNLARLANYPTESIVKTKALIPEMGIKTCSCSNSFAAYHKQVLLMIGGFPTNTILGEDVSVAARFILQGKAVAYAADAQVLHSHDYTLIEEFKRYFDIGVFHRAEQSVLKEFSSVKSEGVKYFVNELFFLKNNGYLSAIPAQLARTFAKYSGYQLGIYHNSIPTALKKKFSMHSSFWK